MSSPGKDPRQATSEVGGDPAATGEVINVRRGMFGVAGSGDTSGYGRLVREITLPGSSPRPYGGYFDDVADALTGALQRQDADFGDVIEKVVVDRNELTLHVRREHLVRVAQVLRDEPELRFELCLGVSGVHYPHETGRELHAVYPLQSITHNRRLRLEVSAPDSDPHIPLGGIPVEYKGAKIPPPDERRGYN
jgi:NADH-quinone oxidoreductase subunit C